MPLLLSTLDQTIADSLFRRHDQGIPLQTELLAGMESHLGVKRPGEKWRGVETPEPEKPIYASMKPVFEMVDVEGVRSRAGCSCDVF